MKLARAILAAILCALPAAGCVTTTPPPAVQMTAAKSLYAAEAAFSGVTLALEAAVDSGRLKGANAAKANVIYAKAHASLGAARAAKAVGDQVGMAAQAAAALALIAQVQQLATTGGGFGTGTLGETK